MFFWSTYCPLNEGVVVGVMVVLVAFVFPVDNPVEKVVSCRHLFCCYR